MEKIVFYAVILYVKWFCYRILKILSYHTCSKSCYLPKDAVQFNIVSLRRLSIFLDNWLKRNGQKGTDVFKGNSNELKLYAVGA